APLVAEVAPEERRADRLDLELHELAGMRPVAKDPAPELAVHGRRLAAVAREPERRGSREDLLQDLARRAGAEGRHVAVLGHAAEASLRALHHLLVEGLDRADGALLHAAREDRQP